MADQPSSVTLFQNVCIFDGKDDVVSAPSEVLVEGSHIARISETALASDPDRRVTIVAGGGRVLMPGLIDRCGIAAVDPERIVREALPR